MKRMVLAGLTAAAFMFGGVSDAEAQKRTCTREAPCNLRISTVAPDNTPWATQLQSLEERIEEASGGRINVMPRLGASAGENSLARQCRDGSLEGIGVSTAAIATLVPALSVFEIPFLFDTPQQADNVIDRHLFSRIDRLLADAGFKLYIFTENGFRNFATTNGRVIRSAADFQGLQMRAQDSWIHEAMYRALRANFTTIPVTETQTALSTGRVNGFDNTPLFAQAAGWHNSINTWIVSNHIYQPAVVVYNKAWFDSLPDDLQEILLTNRAEETRTGRRLVRRINPLLIQNLRASGVNVVELTAAERSSLRESTRGVRDEFRRRVPEGAQLLDIIERNL